MVLPAALLAVLAVEDVVGAAVVVGLEVDLFPEVARAVGTTGGVFESSVELAAVAGAVLLDLAAVALVVLLQAAA